MRFLSSLTRSGQDNSFVWFDANVYYLNITMLMKMTLWDFCHRWQNQVRIIHLSVLMLIDISSKYYNADDNDVCEISVIAEKIRSKFDLTVDCLLSSFLFSGYWKTHQLGDNVDVFTFPRADAEAAKIESEWKFAAMVRTLLYSSFTFKSDLQSSCICLILVWPCQIFQFHVFKKNHKINVWYL